MADRAYGLARDEKDERDHRRIFEDHHIKAAKDTAIVDLSKYIPHDYNQGRLESCTANALCSAYGLELREQQKKDPRFHYFEPSRLFVYYNSRVYAGAEAQNVPVSYRNALMSIHDSGVCKESTWPYDFSKFNEKPPDKAYKEAEGNTISKYERLDQDEHQLKASLKCGSPFTVGMELYESFNDLEKAGNDGNMKMPSKEELMAGPWGLHAVLAVGYNAHKRMFKILNSYGDTFGTNGFFYMPFDYALNPDRCFDFWTLTHSTESDVPASKKKKTEKTTCAA